MLALGILPIYKIDMRQGKMLVRNCSMLLVVREVGWRHLAKFKQIKELTHLHHASQLNSQTASDHPYNEKTKPLFLQNKLSPCNTLHNTTQPSALRKYPKRI